MYRLLPLLFIVLLSCSKNRFSKSDCDIQQTRKENATKPTITEGVWGTVSFTEGNCMPVVGPDITSCVTCPVQRTVRIYEYTTISQANYQPGSGGFYESFNTNLVSEVQTDANGFFQAELPKGSYTVVIMEKGKLYANLSDGQGGINPVVVEGGREQLDVNINYQAAY